MPRRQGKCLLTIAFFATGAGIRQNPPSHFVGVGDMQAIGWCCRCFGFLQMLQFQSVSRELADSAE
jgi:hypothetical protein